MILVVGDAILDVDRRFTTTRMCPEKADAPVLTPLHAEAEMRLGGALNVWNAIRQLGVECDVISSLGNDQGGALVAQMMGYPPAENDGTTNPTTVKERIYVDGVLKFRMDTDRGPETDAVYEGIDEDVEKRLRSKKVDLLVLSDYGKGVLARPQRMIRVAVELGIPVIVDPKGADWQRYEGATVLKPNFYEETGHAYEPDVHFKVITDGAYGMRVLGGGLDSTIYGIPRKTVDVTGAGDMACAALAVCLAKRKGLPSGADVVRAARVANVLASASVEYQGVKTFTRKEAENECRKHGVAFSV